jgi:hypothetical protein
MSTKTARDELIDRFSHDTEDQGRLERVVVISIDPSSANYVLDWAFANFLHPAKDLVRRKTVISIDLNAFSCRLSW